MGIVLGPHPVVWEKQSKSIGLAKSSELHLEAIKLALDYIENDQAHCLGEVEDRITPYLQISGTKQMKFYWKHFH